MAENIDIWYGIKYKVIRIDKEQFILFPTVLVEGQLIEEGFKTEECVFPQLSGKNKLNNKYIVDNVFLKEELEYVYDYDDSSEEFLKEFFFEDYKDTIIYVNTNDSKGFKTKTEINLRLLNEDDKDITYCMDRNIPSIILNEGALNEMISRDSIEEIKLIATKYKRLLESFKENNENKEITRLNVVNGKLNFIETYKKINKKTIGSMNLLVQNNEKDKSSFDINTDISYQGLKQYIKERVFGHDEEIDTLAQKLYMNYTAEKGEKIESILLVGPTGTGKTETVKAACQYLDIPTFETNASNIVPQGIKGTSIEDVIVGLYENALRDIKKAERGLIFLDEFDKLNASDLEIKASVKDILLTFTEGGTFLIDNDKYTFNFDSSMTSKVYAGVFEEISKREKQVGFNSDQNFLRKLGTEREIRKKIIEKGYFSLEELTRISTILGYEELDRETKKRILTGSKLSELIKKRDRYKRQFGIDLITDEDYIDAILDSITEEETGMRSVNNKVKETINCAEKSILESVNKGYKKLVLTKETVDNPTKFDLS